MVEHLPQVQKEGVLAQQWSLLFQRESWFLDTQTVQKQVQKPISLAKWQKAGFQPGRQGLQPSTSHHFFKRKVGFGILTQCRNRLSSKQQWLSGRLQHYATAIILPGRKGFQPRTSHYFFKRTLVPGYSISADTLLDSCVSGLMVEHQPSIWKIGVPAPLQTETTIE